MGAVMSNEMLERIIKAIEETVPPYKIRYEVNDIIIIYNKNECIFKAERTLENITKAEDEFNRLQQLWVARKIVEAMRNIPISVYDKFDGDVTNALKVWNKWIDAILKE